MRKNNSSITKKLSLYLILFMICFAVAGILSFGYSDKLLSSNLTSNQSSNLSINEDNESYFNDAVFENDSVFENDPDLTVGLSETNIAKIVYEEEEDFSVESNSTAIEKNNPSSELFADYANICEEDSSYLITSDNSFLWKTKTTFESIDYFFTFDSTKKAKKSLMSAKERLCELQKLVNEDKISSVGLLEESYSKKIDSFEKNIEKVSEESDIYDLNKLFLEQKQFVLGLESMVEKDESTKYSIDEKKMIKSFANSFLATDEKVKVVVSFKIKKFEIKNKAKEEKIGDDEKEINESLVKAIPIVPFVDIKSRLINGTKEAN